MSLPQAVKDIAEVDSVDWLTRSDMAHLARLTKSVDEVLEFPRKGKFNDIVLFAKLIGEKKYSHIYDAHNSLRSRLILLLVRLLFPMNRTKFLTRPRNSFSRFLMFWARTKMPKDGQQQFLIRPLKRWGIVNELPQVPVYKTTSTDKAIGFLNGIESEFVVLAPGASYALKRWPIGNFKQLTSEMKNVQFVALGGPDESFIEELKSENVRVSTGHLNLAESAFVVSKAKAVVSNDTSLLHFAEQYGIPAVALMGPAPFGYPSRPTTKILESDVPCRPCSKHGQGPCRHLNEQFCMTSLSPEKVRDSLNAFL